MFEGFLFRPLRERDDVGFLDRAIVFVAQHVLEQHLHRVRQLGNALEAVLFSGRQAVIDVGFAADLEGFLAFEAVE